jgi:hypothetical protein
MAWDEAISIEFFTKYQLGVFLCDRYNMRRTTVMHAKKGDYEFEGMRLSKVVKSIAQILLSKVK